MARDIKFESNGIPYTAKVSEKKAKEFAKDPNAFVREEVGVYPNTPLQKCSVSKKK